MRLGGGGYTIVEVLIFLAVSGMLLVSAAVALGGAQGHAEFNTSMSDINTKMQQWIDQVANGFSGSDATPSASSYHCGLDPLTSQPKLDNTISTALGTNVDCVFLGKVIQVNIKQGFNQVITAYPVLGRRTYQVTLPDGTTVSNSSDSLQIANPVAAVFPGINLSEKYQLENGVQAVSVKSIDSKDGQGSGASHSRLFGFFNSFNTEAQADTSNGNLSLLAVQYPYEGDDSPDSANILDCIKLSTGLCATPPSASPTNLWHLGEMDICFQSTHNGEQAVLKIDSSDGLGATTNLSFGNCGF